MIWVLTKTYNEYDQQGDYLETAWIGKPTIETIAEYLNCDLKLATHINKGGGRENYEDEWYHLTQLEGGEKYKHKY